MKELLRDSRVRRLLVANTLGSIGSGSTILSVPWLLVHLPGGNEAFRWATIGTTLVLVTHDLELARKCQRIIRLKSGAVVSDETA